MPRSRTALVGTAAAVTAAVLVLAGCGGSAVTVGATPGATESVTSGPAATGMTAGQGSPGDIVFAQSMIPHHQQAVEMADLALAKASSAEVRSLATAIKAAQDPEISTMRGWLQGWGAPQAMAGMEGHDMGSMTEGMMTDEQLAGLVAASGPDFDTLWLTMMIQHHQGAVVMARGVLGQSQDPDVKTLAQAIVDAQNAEISTMEGLLAR